MTDEEIRRYCIERLGVLEDSIWRLAGDRGYEQTVKNATYFSRLMAGALLQGIQRDVSAYEQVTIGMKEAEHDAHVGEFQSHSFRSASFAERHISLAFMAYFGVWKDVSGGIFSPEKSLLMVESAWFLYGQISCAIGMDSSQDKEAAFEAMRTRVISELGKQGADARHKESRSEREFVKRYWRENIDRSLSADKAAEELSRRNVVNLGHRTLARIVSEAKKEQKG
jgi:hypothetical protein